MLYSKKYRLLTFVATFSNLFRSLSNISGLCVVFPGFVYSFGALYNPFRFCLVRFGWGFVLYSLLGLCLLSFLFFSQYMNIYIYTYISPPLPTRAPRRRRRWPKAVRAASPNNHATINNYATWVYLRLCFSICSAAYSPCCVFPVAYPHGPPPRGCATHNRNWGWAVHKVPRFQTIYLAM